MTTAGRSLTGPAGSAVEVLDYATDPAAHDGGTATVALWIVDAPGQSPAWSQFLLSIVHLRPIPGPGGVLSNADIRIPGATHEVIVGAIDPGRPGRPNEAIATDSRTWSMLRPLNVVEQLVGITDQQAADLAALVAQAIVDGRLWAEPPLSGQVEPWRTTLIQTTAHQRGEPHGNCTDHG